MEIVKSAIAFLISLLVNGFRALFKRTTNDRSRVTGELAEEGDRRADAQEAARKDLEERIHTLEVEESQLIGEAPSEDEAEAFVEKAKRWR